MSVVLLRGSWLLAKRELLRFVRQPVRIVAALGTSAAMWGFLAAGVGDNVRHAQVDASFGLYVLPGAMTLVAVFTAIFSAISLIEDRNDGFLQAVLVAPGAHRGVALGKILGGGIMAFVQAAVLLPLAWVQGARFDALGAGAALAGLALAAIATSAVGVYFAWRSETSAAFHAVMNLVLMPMWLLSGAFFPAEGAAWWLGILMRIDPLTWMTNAVRAGLTGGEVALPLAVSAGWTAVLVLLAMRRR